MHGCDRAGQARSTPLDTPRIAQSGAGVWLLAIVRFGGSCHTLFSGAARCATADPLVVRILAVGAIAVADLPVKLWQRKMPLGAYSHPCAIPVQYFLMKSIE